MSAESRRGGCKLFEILRRPPRGTIYIEGPSIQCNTYTLYCIHKLASRAFSACEGYRLDVDRAPE